MDFSSRFGYDIEVDKSRQVRQDRESSWSIEGWQPTFSSFFLSDVDLQHCRSMPMHMDFFLSLASTYTYLSVNRAEELATSAGVVLHWRPFSVRTIMTEQNNRPFAGKPVKLAYMWRDLERRAQRHGIPFASVPRYPVDADGLANRVATLAALEGWCPEFARASYQAWFLENNDPGGVENLSRVLLRTGRDPGEIIARADSPEIHEKLAGETDVARALGIFGSPTFVCGTELFWGDDRLEEAIDWCTSH